MFAKCLILSTVFSLRSAFSDSPLLEEVKNASSPDLHTTAYVRHGDVILGGLFPLHSFNESTGECFNVLSMNDLKMAEAMVFAIDQVNANDTLLPGVKLGFEIYDTCLTPTIALENALNFLPSQKAYECNNPKESPPCTSPATGVVGSERSTSSMQTSSLLQIYRIPQISYMATVTELSNIRKYPYFLRTVPPDYIQSQVLVDVILKFGWSFVSAVHSDDIYGHSGMTTFRRFAEDNGICFGAVLEISASYGNAECDRLVRQLLRYENATVVVLFAQREEIQLLLNAAVRNGATDSLTWLATNGWGSFCQEPINAENQEAAYGALLVSPFAERSPEFDEYFSSLVASESDNPWLTEYLVHHYDCVPCPELDSSANPDQISCDDPSLLEDIDGSSMESLVINAVLAFAHSLNKIQGEMCSAADPLCWTPNPLWQKMLMNRLLNSSFYGPTGLVSFNEVGDSPGKYFIRNIQQNAENNDGYACAEVGLWEEGADWQNGKLDFYRGVHFYRNKTWHVYDAASDNGSLPVSICSEPCREDEIRTIIDDLQCCWICSPCQDWEVIRQEGTRCRACPAYTWPNENRTKCELIEPSYLQQFAPNVAIFLTLITSIGIIATVLTSVIYIGKYSVPLIKASGRELCYLILFGILYAFVMNYFYIFQPTDTICFLRRFSPIGYTLIFGALATKTNRVYRIFRRGKKSALKPRFISPRSQIIITMILVTVQFTLSMMSILCVYPNILYVMPLSTMNYVEIHCDRCVVVDALRLTWNWLLLVTSLYQGMKTRKLPHNYNESKFITFCVFGTFVIGLSSVPAYAVTSFSVISTLYLISVFECIAYMSLIFLFFPKLYAIYFVSEDKITLEDTTDIPGTSSRNWESRRCDQPPEENETGGQQPSRRRPSISVDSDNNVQQSEAADGFDEENNSIQPQEPRRLSREGGKKRPLKILPISAVDDNNQTESNESPN